MLKDSELDDDEDDELLDKELLLDDAPCACCVNLYVCMYNVTYGILRVFPYFYHCITLLVFSCLFCFCFLIKFSSLFVYVCMYNLAK
jgi:hypothetical protein